MACLSDLPQIENSLLARENIFPLFSYGNELVRKSLWALKYRGVRDIRDAFSEKLYQKISAQVPLEGSGTIALIPIPQTKKSFRSRGYNQAELLARALAEKYPGQFTVIDALYRIRKTKRQTGLAARERLKNVSNAFALQNGISLSGKTLVIVDDIITTGATVREAKRAVGVAGPKMILIVSVAYQSLMPQKSGATL